VPPNRSAGQRTSLNERHEKGNESTEKKRAGAETPVVDTIEKKAALSPLSEQRPSDEHTRELDSEGKDYRPPAVPSSPLKSQSRVSPKAYGVTCLTMPLG
jgi:hypothetical protein